MIDFFMSIDYEYKSRILKTDLCKRINAIDKKTYVNAINGVVSDNELDTEYFDLLLQYDFNDIKEARKINDARYKRVKRLRDRIKTFLLNGDNIFLTLTFNDDTLTKTNEKQRRVAVVRYLKTFNCPYIANIDFGVKNHREHYHAIVNCKHINLKPWYKYGSIDVKHIRNGHIETDTYKLSKYIAKLTNHAIKETTKRTALIYSR